MKVKTMEQLLFSEFSLDYRVLLFLLTYFGWAAQTNKNQR